MINDAQPCMTLWLTIGTVVAFERHKRNLTNFQKRLLGAS